MLERFLSRFQGRPYRETKPVSKAFTADERLWNKEIKEFIAERINDHTDHYIRCGCDNCLHNLRQHGEMNVKHFAAYTKDVAASYDIKERLEANQMVAGAFTQLTNDIRAFESGKAMPIFIPTKNS